MNKEFSKIQYFNRYSGQIETEKVYGDAFVKAMYKTSLGKILAPIVTSRYLSKAYGQLQSNMFTQLKVPGFVKSYKINLDEYEPGSVQVGNQTLSYRNFNEFFIRKFKPGIRVFEQTLATMPAFSEARYFGHSTINNELKVPVKGKFLGAIELIGDKKLANDFVGGPLLIARLCPVDYHRYHYPDNGTTVKAFQIKGGFHSVNPLALRMKENIFIENERRVAILQTENFGKLAYIEVGATCVGKIVQTFDEDQPFQRGDEKGYFLFGGSTVIVLGEPGFWTPSEDILTNTAKGLETYIKLGDGVATKVRQ